MKYRIFLHYFSRAVGWQPLRFRRYSLLLKLHAEGGPPATPCPVLEPRTLHQQESRSAIGKPVGSVVAFGVRFLIAALTTAGRRVARLSHHPPTAVLRPSPPSVILSHVILGLSKDEGRRTLGVALATPANGVIAREHPRGSRGLSFVKLRTGSLSMTRSPPNPRS